MTWHVECADVLDWAAGYEGEPFMAVLCDPPYNFSFMGKKWDDAVAMQPDTWAAIASHLSPGAFLMAFGGPRTYHRLAVAMEDAGLVIHPAAGWLQGQGFPKATRIKFPEWALAFSDDPFTGHRYGLQALKPCLEFIAVAQKPYENKPVDDITATGAGALNIDGGRVGTNGRPKRIVHPLRDDVEYHPNSLQGRVDGSLASSKAVGTTSQGRWPANVCLSHSPGCVRRGEKRVNSRRAETPDVDEGRIDKSQWRFRPTPATSRGYADADGLESVADWDCVDGCAVKALAEMSGERVSKWGKQNEDAPGWYGADAFGGRKEGIEKWRGDRGTAARFFTQADWSHEIAERLAGETPFMYCAKAARSERDAGLDEFAEKRRSYMSNANGTGETWHPVDDRTGKPRDRFKALARNGHPTVKPITLCKWLATLLLPPPEYAPRRILIPFSGSGSESIGAMLAGWDDITAIEMNTEYCNIAEARLVWWEAMATQMMFNDPRQIVRLGKNQP